MISQRLVVPRSLEPTGPWVISVTHHSARHRYLTDACKGKMTRARHITTSSNVTFSKQRCRTGLVDCRLVPEKATRPIFSMEEAEQACLWSIPSIFFFRRPNI